MAYTIFKQSSGNPIKSSQTGAIFGSDECCCGEGETCNNCNPPPAAALTLTLAGLAGDFAPCNGAHPISLVTGVYCGYTLDTPCGGIVVSWIFGAPTPYWQVLSFGLLCAWTFDGPTTPCDATGNYGNFQCASALCSDTNSCANSAGATCVVA
jgi:hypothetical protein